MFFSLRFLFKLVHTHKFKLILFLLSQHLPFLNSWVQSHLFNSFIPCRFCASTCIANHIISAPSTLCTSASPNGMRSLIISDTEPVLRLLAMQAACSIDYSSVVRAETGNLRDVRVPEVRDGFFIGWFLI